MATFTSEGLDDLILSMEEVAAMPEDVMDEILHAQADFLVEQLKLRGEGYGVYSKETEAIFGSPKMTLLNSIKKGKPKRGKSGGRQLIVAPRGKRIRGKEKKHSVRNAEIAFLVNFGTRSIAARPFWTDTEKLSDKSMMRIARDIFDQWLQTKNL